MANGHNASRSMLSVTHLLALSAAKASEELDMTQTDNLSMQADSYSELITAQHTTAQHM